MKERIVIAIIIAFVAGPQLAYPGPDPLNFLVGGSEAALLCAVPLLILARLAFMRTASKSVQTLVCGLICVVAILLLTCQSLAVRVGRQQRWLNERARSSSETSAAVRVDNTSHDTSSGRDSRSVQ